METKGLEALSQNLDTQTPLRVTHPLQFIGGSIKRVLTKFFSRSRVRERPAE